MDKTSNKLNTVLLEPREVLHSGKTLIGHGLIMEQSIRPPKEVEVRASPYAVITYVVTDIPQQVSRYAGASHEGFQPKGTFLLVPPGVDGFFAWNSVDEGLTALLEPAYLTQIAADAAVSAPVELMPAPLVTDATLERLFLLLGDEIKHSGVGERLYVDSLVKAIGVRLLRRHSVFPVTFKQYERGLSKADLQRVTDYLQDNLAADVSLDTLAGVVAVSPHHFCRLFKQITGLSPHQYVIEKRVERAKALLLRGRMSIAEVALTVGFADVSHLNRSMKRLLGTTPGKVQRQVI